MPIRNWLKYGRAADCPSSTLPVSRPSSPTIRSFPVWSLPNSLCLSQHHSRPPGRRFVIPHHSLRFLRLVRCQIMRPPKPDGLKPKFRIHFERSRCIPGRDHIPHRASAVCESRIVGRIACHGDILACGGLIEAVRQQPIVLQVPDSMEQTGRNLPLRILQDRFVNFHFL